MIIDEKPDLGEDLIVHYGIRGMKWGKRKGSSKTGVSRARGAMIDRNDRQIHTMRQMMRGKSGKINNLAYKLEVKLAGEKETKRHMQTRIANLQDQNARLKTGKATFMDKLEIFQTTRPLDLLVSNRPK